MMNHDSRGSIFGIPWYFFFYLGLLEIAGLERSQKKAHEFQISWKRAKNMFNAQEQE